MIASVSKTSKIVVEKSTVPVKTAEAIEKVASWPCTDSACHQCRAAPEAGPLASAGIAEKLLRRERPVRHPLEVRCRPSDESPLRSRVLCCLRTMHTRTGRVQRTHPNSMASCHPSTRGRWQPAVRRWTLSYIMPSVQKPTVALLRIPAPSSWRRAQPSRTCSRPTGCGPCP